MYFILKLLLNTFALIVVVKVVPGIHIAGWQTAFLAALALGFVNAVIRPVLIVLTLPLNILTLGLLTFVINALLFYSVPMFVPGFQVDNFSVAFWGSLLFSIVSSILSLLAVPTRLHFFSHHSSGGKKYKDAIDVEGKHQDEE
jgi:putative membrane protein